MYTKMVDLLPTDTFGYALRRCGMLAEWPLLQTTMRSQTTLSTEAFITTDNAILEEAIGRQRLDRYDPALLVFKVRYPTEGYNIYARLLKQYIPSLDSHQPKRASLVKIMADNNRAMQELFEAESQHHQVQTGRLLEIQRRLVNE